MVFLSPVLLLLIPSFVANTIHHTSGSWHVIIPKEGYITYGVAFIFLCLAPFIVFIYDMKKKSIIIALILVFFSGVFFYLASFHFISIGGKSIMYREGYFKEEYHYSWDDVKKAEYYEVPRSDGFSTYNIFFEDGNTVSLKENGIVRNYRRAIYAKLSERNIAVE
ncbi:hypothetical protein [Bacillus suaedae]|uniref:hypothetical protein n=1 Tax=Halalkalibacter suaedae TaxID=2822140 RepID=UPI001B34512A|nr:hypothetical protein [Bacillus suaedae]